LHFLNNNYNNKIPKKNKAEGKEKKNQGVIAFEK
jgi:hypothetical protein